MLAIVVYFIRRGLDETLSYENVAARPERRRSTIGNLFRDHPREAFLVMALTAGGTAAFYAYTIYMQKFLANTSGFDRATASRIMTVALTVMLFIGPIGGRISDTIGRKPMMIFFGVGATLFTYPIFATLEQTHERRDRLRAGHGEPGHRQRLHLDQRDHQSRDVPGRHPRARGRAAVRDRQRDVRRHRRICRAVSQEHRATSAGSTSTSRCSRRCR